MLAWLLLQEPPVEQSWLDMKVLGTGIRHGLSDVLATLVVHTGHTERGQRIDGGVG